MLVEKVILETAGIQWRLREARRRLFILTNSAAAGMPAIVETEGGLVCLIALDDLLDVVVEPGPTLGEVMEAAKKGLR